MLKRAKLISNLSLRLLQTPTITASAGDCPTLLGRIPATSADAESICSLLSNPPSGRLLDLDSLLLGFEPKLTSDLLLEVLKSHHRLGSSVTLEFFSWAGFRLGFCLDDPVVEYMADFLGRMKLFDDLKWLLKTVARHNGRVSSRSVTISIRCLGIQGRVAEALALFEVMESELKCPPDNMAFNTLLKAIWKQNLSDDSIDAALRVFGMIQQPDVYSYSNLIVGLCRFGRLESAFKVFSEMARCDLAPARTAADILIIELCRFGGKEILVERVSVTDCRRPYDILVPNLKTNGFLELAIEVFRLIERLGLLPSSHAMDALVMRLCQAGKVEEAIKIIEVLENRNPNYVGKSYSIVIRTLCEALRMTEACNLFGRMMDVGMNPEHIVYNSMIWAFCKLGNVPEARKYFDIMNKKRRDPDCTTYTMLVHANCRMQNWQEAYKLLMEMIGLGWRPSFDTVKLVEGSLKKNGELELSMKLKRKMEVQYLYAHCRTGQFEDAYDKFSSMLAMGFYPPVYVRDAFESAFRNSSKWKIAQELLKKMEMESFQVNLKLEKPSPPSTISF